MGLVNFQISLLSGDWRLTHRSNYYPEKERQTLFDINQDKIAEYFPANVTVSALDGRESAAQTQRLSISGCKPFPPMPE